MNDRTRWNGNTHIIELEHNPDMPNPDCPECGKKMRIHDSRVMDLRSMPVSTFNDCHWKVHYNRYKCPSCGCSFWEDIPFRFKGSRSHGYKVNNELASHVWQRMWGSTVKNVAMRLNLSWGTVKEIEYFFMDKAVNAAGIPKDITYLGIDEKYIGRSNKKMMYITIISSLTHRRPIWMCEGKSMEAIEPFFSWAGKELLDNVKAISMDANAGYATSFRKHCPNAVTVLDRFHLMKDFGDQCTRPIRLRVYRSLLEKNPRLANMFKNSGRVSLSRPENLTDKGKGFLDQLKKANDEFNTCIIIQEQLRSVYELAEDRKDMERRWNDWLRAALESDIEEIVKFALRRNTKKKLAQILDWADYKISNGPIEGMNRRIDDLLRSGYGLSDLQYLFTKIKFVFLPAEFRNSERNVDIEVAKEIDERIKTKLQNQGETPKL